MEWIKKNWLVLCIGCLLILALTGAGIREFQAFAVRRDLAQARGRIAELENTVDRTGKLAEKLEILAGDLKARGDRFEKLYIGLRDYNNQLEEGNSDLRESNDRSIGLLARGLEILRQLQEDDDNNL